jgi:hypothetical protein
MELKRIVRDLTYNIEPKPEGGFIAHATDSTVPPVEAASREELLQKIKAEVAANLASEFPGLKLPLGNQELKGAFDIEHTPRGGFAIPSADANAPQSGNSPITPESSRGWTTFSFLLALLVVATLTYFFVHR